MSVNFYNNSAIMVGIDVHDFYPFPGVVEDQKVPWPYAVGAPFFWPAANFWHRTGTITADGWQMIHDEFSLFLVPHVHLFAEMGLLQVPQYAKILGPSGSEPMLAIGSVTGQGNPLAACMFGALGLNFNCWEKGDQPTGYVLSVTSVKTSPTLADLASGAVKWVSLGFLAPRLGEIVGARLGGIGGPLESIPISIIEFITEQIVKKLMEPVAKEVHDWVEAQQKG
ncbi:hypothetical protein [Polyangium spumosum]|uniref:Uncharacterized protein n=1 Tax=Polyangium spumosum TaxID=889282 RepID=A0A6N7PRP8_9BACT|nr:hypothetical protein [Polyangium spumosum]MRG93030.1 hypothetical protein [Polyangium spumosum]